MDLDHHQGNSAQVSKQYNIQINLGLGLYTHHPLTLNSLV